ncbi:hypothetical protein JOF53_005918 [Crossiella equi]|uniref:Uncharacterized protein n=1 Tax=Crossiella equi TaxID=130796 RepID=A0ABS5AKE5_9PSEU|nr:hypothetical protein [Crossiella equi]MBP2477046.1 hypothetical protein [Crossiella equi]
MPAFHGGGGRPVTHRAQHPSRLAPFDQQAGCTLDAASGAGLVQIGRLALLTARDGEDWRPVPLPEEDVAWEAANVAGLYRQPGGARLPAGGGGAPPAGGDQLSGLR